MTICFLCTEIFAWNKYGGFGRATRFIARELVKRGYDISAIVPQRRGQSEIEILDGIKVYGFPLYNPFKVMSLSKIINADIYHSQEPSFITRLAQKAMPFKKHIVTFRDPRLWDDWILEFKNYSKSKLQVLYNYIFEDKLFIKNAVKKCDARFCAAEYLIPIVKKKYSLKESPLFLPTPIHFSSRIQKSKKPTVCFISRFDRRKRPELFFELASSFPEVEFIAAGKARNANWNSYLHKKYGSISNLSLVGFLNQFTDNTINEIYNKSWILINTASREGLPNSFLEAAAHSCAILSMVNPNNFTSNFGYHAKHEDFKKGLSYLLKNNRWCDLGKKGRKFVMKNFEMKKAIDEHIEVYKQLLHFSKKRSFRENT